MTTQSAAGPSIHPSSSDSSTGIAVTRIAPSGLPVYAITKGSVNGSHFEMARDWDGTVPEVLADVLEPLTRGKLYRATWACPVNGDGYRYWRQELVNAAGEVRGTVRRDDLGSEEL